MNKNKLMIIILCGTALFAMASSILLLLFAIEALDSRITRLENMTQTQELFNFDVIDWSKMVNSAITELYNQTR